RASLMPPMSMRRSRERKLATVRPASMRNPAQGMIRGPETASDVAASRDQRDADSTRAGIRSGLSLGNFMRRPETGSLLGLLAVFAFFTVFGGAKFASPIGAASWLNVAASIGIVAIPIGLLMIAGELDISIGSIIPAGS